MNVNIELEKGFVAQLNKLKEKYKKVLKRNYIKTLNKYPGRKAH